MECDKQWEEDSKEIKRLFSEHKEQVDKLSKGLRDFMLQKYDVCSLSGKQLHLYWTPTANMGLLVNTCTQGGEGGYPPPKIFFAPPPPLIPADSPKIALFLKKKIPFIVCF